MIAIVNIGMPTRSHAWGISATETASRPLRYIQTKAFKTGHPLEYNHGNAGMRAGRPFFVPPDGQGCGNRNRLGPAHSEPPVVVSGDNGTERRYRGSSYKAAANSENAYRGATTMETTKHNLQSLRDEFGALAAEVTRLMENSDQHEADELKNRIDQVRAKFESAVSDVSDSSRDAIHELSKNIADVVEESLRERPIATLALALGVGFIVGTALRR